MTATRVRPLLSTLVRAPSSTEEGSSKHSLYLLSPCDQLSITTVTARASFWKDTRFDEGALQRCMEMVLQDLPFLSGRYGNAQMILGFLFHKLVDLRTAPFERRMYKAATCVGLQGRAHPGPEAGQRAHRANQ
jgi:hypothetical protein